jgi:hypothetical protein
MTLKPLGIAAIVMLLLQNVSTGNASDPKGLLLNLADKHKVPREVALKIGTKETGISCNKWGDGGKSGGILQIYWPTAQSKYAVDNFKRFKAMSCEELTDMGMQHLKTCWTMAKGNLWKASACHNAGWGIFSGKRIPSMAKRYADIVVRMKLN